MLGLYQHKENLMKAIYIAKHNKTTRKICKLLKGPKANHFIIVDVGQLKGPWQLGVHNNRMAEFVRRLEPRLPDCSTNRH